MSKPRRPTDFLTAEELEEYYAKMTPACAAAARKFPANTCYRQQGYGGHYWIYSFNDGPPPTCKLIHGADSFNPGTVVFGVDPESLVKCGCGEWEQPTDEQVAAFRKYAATLHPGRGKHRTH